MGNSSLKFEAREKIGNFSSFLPRFNPNPLGLELTGRKEVSEMIVAEYKVIFVAQSEEEFLAKKRFLDEVANPLLSEKVRWISAGVKVAREGETKED